MPAARAAVLLVLVAACAPNAALPYRIMVTMPGSSSEAVALQAAFAEAERVCSNFGGDFVGHDRSFANTGAGTTEHFFNCAALTP